MSLRAVLRVIARTMLLLILPAPVLAQGVGFGLAGGATMSEINVSGDEGLNVAFTDKLEPIGGIFLAFDISDSFSIQPEALFAIRGTRSQIGSLDQHVRLYYLDTPILFRFASPALGRTQLHLFVGPYVGWLLSAQLRTSGSAGTVNVGDAFKGTDLGWTFGTGLGIRPVRIDFRYDVGVRNIRESGALPIPIGNESVRFRNRAFSLIAAVRF